MTDAERQTLCNILRAISPWPCKQAADEIEWLAKRLEAAHGYADECKAKIKFLSDQIDKMLVAPALAQSNAEPGGLTERIVRALERRRFTDQHGRYLLTQTGAYEACREALAQSNAEPVAWQDERAIGMREAVRIIHAANLSSAELRLVDKHCDWQAFKHAFNAVMKARAARVLASVDAIEAKRAARASDRSGK